MNVVDKARKFAERAHKDQQRKYTGEPYLVHLDEVAKLCAKHGCSKRAIAAAYLHDVIEDQPVTYRMLVSSFGKEIADLVGQLTDAPKSFGNRKKRKAMDLGRIAAASSEAQTIKCADTISNTTSIALHDVDFARTYLPEIRKILSVMTRPMPVLHKLAWESLIKAERKIANA